MYVNSVCKNADLQKFCQFFHACRRILLDNYLLYYYLVSNVKLPIKRKVNKLILVCHFDTNSKDKKKTDIKIICTKDLAE